MLCICSWQVWEVRGAELSLSPVHRAASGHLPGTDRGLALRFPRFIRVRDTHTHTHTHTRTLLLADCLHASLVVRAFRAAATFDERGLCLILMVHNEHAFPAAPCELHM